MRAAVLSIATAIGAASLAAQAPQPTFHSGIELIVVEASVLDRDGRPVGDLAQGDFDITLDGRPRPVRQVRFHDGSAVAGGAITGGAAPVIPAAVHNRTEDGRIVVFVVDRDSIQPGSERALLDGAAGILDSLGPSDASGIFELPGAGMTLTREHDRVRAALRRVTGTRPSIIERRERDITWDEALAFERDDRRSIGFVIERECYRIPEGRRNSCPDELRLQAANLLQAGRARVQVVMSNLSSLAAQLAPLRGPKQLVILSSGLPFGQDLLHWFNDFERHAAAAGLAVSVVHFDPPEIDVTARGKTTTSAFGGRDQSAGLGAIAGQTGGAFYTVGGSGAGIFEKIATEMGHYYELAIEAQPGDAGSRPMRLEINVTRPGLVVRAPRHVVAAARSTSPLPERVGALLRQPTDRAELPVLVSAYSMRGDEASTLRVVIGVEVGAERFPGPAEWGFVAFHEGNAVASGRQPIEAAGAAPWPAALSAKLLPGRYRLRVAAADAGGRSGVLDLPLTVGLRAAGALQLSDLMLGVAVNGRLQPQSRIAGGAAMAGLLEVIGADTALLEKARTLIEIFPGGSADPVKRFQMAARSGASPTIMTHHVEIATLGLPPGRYTAAATVVVADQPIGRVSRVFEIH